MADTGLAPAAPRSILTAPSEDVKLIIETMTRCGGSCGGCALTEADRQDGRLMPAAALESFTPFVAAYLSESAERGRVKEASITCALGDHLLADPADLSGLVRWIERAGSGRAIGFLTASAIGGYDRVARAVDAIHSTSVAINQPVWLDLVFDPAKTGLGKFSRVYRRNIDVIRHAFGDVDLNINVGPDTPRVMDPRRLHEFLDGHDFVRFTVNLTPNPGAARAFGAGWKPVIDWILAFLDGWDPARGCEINLAQIHGTFVYLGGDVWNVDSDSIVDIVAANAAKSVVVEASGALTHSQAGFGDVPFFSRFGWRPTHRAELRDGKALPGVDASARAFAVRVARTFVAHPVCSGCRFRPVCARSGIAAIRHVMGGLIDASGFGGCPAGIAPVLERFVAYGEEARLVPMLGCKDVSYVPVGFAPSVRNRASPLRRRSLKPLDFDAITGDDHA